MACKRGTGALRLAASGLFALTFFLLPATARADKPCPVEGKEYTYTCSFPGSTRDKDGTEKKCALNIACSKSCPEEAGGGSVTGKCTGPGEGGCKADKACGGEKIEGKPDVDVKDDGKTQEKPPTDSTSPKGEPKPLEAPKSNTDAKGDLENNRINDAFDALKESASSPSPEPEQKSFFERMLDSYFNKDSTPVGSESGEGGPSVPSGADAASLRPGGLGGSDSSQMLNPDGSLNPNYAGGSPNTFGSPANGSDGRPETGGTQSLWGKISGGAAAIAEGIQDTVRGVQEAVRDYLQPAENPTGDAAGIPLPRARPYQDILNADNAAIEALKAQGANSRQIQAARDAYNSELQNTQGGKQATSDDLAKNQAVIPGTREAFGPPDPNAASRLQERMDSLTADWKKGDLTLSDIRSNLTEAGATKAQIDKFLTDNGIRAVSGPDGAKNYAPAVQDPSKLASSYADAALTSSALNRAISDQLSQAPAAAEREFGQTYAGVEPTTDSAQTRLDRLSEEYNALRAQRDALPYEYSSSGQKYYPDTNNYLKSLELGAKLNSAAEAGQRLAAESGVASEQAQQFLPEALARSYDEAAAAAAQRAQAYDAQRQEVLARAAAERSGGIDAACLGTECLTVQERGGTPMSASAYNEQVDGLVASAQAQAAQMQARADFLRSGDPLAAATAQTIAEGGARAILTEGNLDAMLAARGTIPQDYQFDPQQTGDFPEYGKAAFHQQALERLTSGGDFTPLEADAIRTSNPNNLTAAEFDAQMRQQRFDTGDSYLSPLEATINRAITSSGLFPTNPTTPEQLQSRLYLTPDEVRQQISADVGRAAGAVALEAANWGLLTPVGGRLIGAALRPLEPLLSDTLSFATKGIANATLSSAEQSFFREFLGIGGEAAGASLKAEVSAAPTALDKAIAQRDSFASMLGDAGLGAGDRTIIQNQLNAANAAIERLQARAAGVPIASSPAPAAPAEALSPRFITDGPSGLSAASPAGAGPVSRGLEAEVAAIARPASSFEASAASAAIEPLPSNLSLAPIAAPVGGPVSVIAARSLGELGSTLSAGAEAGVIGRVGVAEVGGEVFAYEVPPGSTRAILDSIDAAPVGAARAEAGEVAAAALRDGIPPISPQAAEPLTLHPASNPPGSFQEAAINNYAQARGQYDNWVSGQGQYPSPVTDLALARAQLGEAGLGATVDDQVYDLATGEVYGRYVPAEGVPAGRPGEAAPSFAKVGETWYPVRGETIDVARPVTRAAEVTNLESLASKSAVSPAQVAADQSLAKAEAQAAVDREAIAASSAKLAEYEQAKAAEAQARASGAEPRPVSEDLVQAVKEIQDAQDYAGPLVTGGSAQDLASAARSGALRDFETAYGKAGGDIYAIDTKTASVRNLSADSSPDKNLTVASIVNGKAAAGTISPVPASRLADASVSSGGRLAVNPETYDGSVLVARSVREANWALQGDTKSIAKAAANDALAFKWNPQSKPAVSSSAGAGSSPSVSVSPSGRAFSDAARGTPSSDSGGFVPSYSREASAGGLSPSSRAAAGAAPPSVATKEVPLSSTPPSRLQRAIDNVLQLFGREPEPVVAAAEYITPAQAEAIRDLNGALASRAKLPTDAPLPVLLNEIDNVTAAFEKLSAAGLHQNLQDRSIRLDTDVNRVAATALPAEPSGATQYAIAAPVAAAEPQLDLPPIFQPLDQLAIRGAGGNALSEDVRQFISSAVAARSLDGQLAAVVEGPVETHVDAETSETVTVRTFDPGAQSGVEEGSAIVFLPGFYVDAGSPTVDDFSRALAAISGRRVYDLSTSALGLTVADENYRSAEAIANYLRSQNVRTVAIAGHSEGGNKAIDLAVVLQDTPDIKVEGLALYNSAGLTNENVPARLAQVTVTQSVQLTALGMRGLANPEAVVPALDLFATMGMNALQRFASNPILYPWELTQEILAGSTLNSRLKDLDPNIPVFLAFADADVVAAMPLTDDIQKYAESLLQPGARVTTAVATGDHLWPMRNPLVAAYAGLEPLGQLAPETLALLNTEAALPPFLAPGVPGEGIAIRGAGLPGQSALLPGAEDVVRDAAASPASLPSGVRMYDAGTDVVYVHAATGKVFASRQKSASTIAEGNTYLVAPDGSLYNVQYTRGGWDAAARAALTTPDAFNTFVGLVREKLAEAKGSITPDLASGLNAQRNRLTLGGTPSASLAEVPEPPVASDEGEIAESPSIQPSAQPETSLAQRSGLGQAVQRLTLGLAGAMFLNAASPFLPELPTGGAMSANLVATAQAAPDITYRPSAAQPGNLSGGEITHGGESKTIRAPVTETVSVPALEDFAGSTGRVRISLPFGYDPALDTVVGVYFPGNDTNVASGAGKAEQIMGQFDSLRGRENVVIVVPDTGSKPGSAGAIEGDFMTPALKKASELSGTDLSQKPVIAIGFSGGGVQLAEALKSGALGKNIDTIVNLDDVLSTRRADDFAAIARQYPNAKLVSVSTAGGYNGPNTTLAGKLGVKPVAGIGEASALRSGAYAVVTIPRGGIHNSLPGDGTLEQIVALTRGNIAPTAAAVPIPAPAPPQARTPVPTDSVKAALQGVSDTISKFGSAAPDEKAIQTVLAVQKRDPRASAARIAAAILRTDPAANSTPTYEAWRDMAANELAGKPRSAPPPSDAQRARADAAIAREGAILRDPLYAAARPVDANFAAALKAAPLPAAVKNAAASAAPLPEGWGWRVYDGRGNALGEVLQLSRGGISTEADLKKAAALVKETIPEGIMMPARVADPEDPTNPEKRITIYTKEAFALEQKLNQQFGVRLSPVDTRHYGPERDRASDGSLLFASKSKALEASRKMIAASTPVDGNPSVRVFNFSSDADYAKLMTSIRDAEGSAPTLHPRQNYIQPKALQTLVLSSLMLGQPDQGLIMATTENGHSSRHQNGAAADPATGPTPLANNYQWRAATVATRVGADALAAQISAYVVAADALGIESVGCGVYPSASFHCDVTSGKWDQGNPFLSPMRTQKQLEGSNLGQVMKAFGLRGATQDPTEAITFGDFTRYRDASVFARGPNGEARYTFVGTNNRSSDLFALNGQPPPQPVPTTVVAGDPWEAGVAPVPMPYPRVFAKNFSQETLDPLTAFSSEPTSPIFASLPPAPQFGEVPLPPQPVESEIAPVASLPVASNLAKSFLDATSRYARGAPTRAQFRTIVLRARDIFYAKGFTEADFNTAFNNPRAHVALQEATWQALREVRHLSPVLSSPRVLTALEFGKAVKESTAPSQITRSAQGADGLYQMMVGTARDLGAPEANQGRGKVNQGFNVIAGTLALNENLLLSPASVKADAETAVQAAYTKFLFGQNSRKTSSSYAETSFAYAERIDALMGKAARGEAVSDADVTAVSPVQIGDNARAIREWRGMIEAAAEAYKPTGTLAAALGGAEEAVPASTPLPAARPVLAGDFFASPDGDALAGTVGIDAPHRIAVNLDTRPFGIWKPAVITPDIGNGLRILADRLAAAEQTLAANFQPADAAGNLAREAAGIVAARDAQVAAEQAADEARMIAEYGKALKAAAAARDEAAAEEAFIRNYADAKAAAAANRDALAARPPGSPLDEWLLQQTAAQQAAQREAFAVAEQVAADEARMIAEYGQALKNAAAARDEAAAKEEFLRRYVQGKTDAAAARDEAEMIAAYGTALKNAAAARDEAAAEEAFIRNYADAKVAAAANRDALAENAVRARADERGALALRLQQAEADAAAVQARADALLRDVALSNIAEVDVSDVLPDALPRLVFVVSQPYAPQGLSGGAEPGAQKVKLVQVAIDSAGKVTIPQIVELTQGAPAVAQLPATPEPSPVRPSAPIAAIEPELPAVRPGSGGARPEAAPVSPAVERAVQEAMALAQAEAGAAPAPAAQEEAIAEAAQRIEDILREPLAPLRDTGVSPVPAERPAATPSVLSPSAWPDAFLSMLAERTAPAEIARAGLPAVIAGSSAPRIEIGSLSDLYESLAEPLPEFSFARGAIAGGEIPSVIPPEPIILTTNLPARPAPVAAAPLASRGEAGGPVITLTRNPNTGVYELGGAEQPVRGGAPEGAGELPAPAASQLPVVRPGPSRPVTLARGEPAILLPDQSAPAAEPDSSSVSPRPYSFEDIGLAELRAPLAANETWQKSFLDYYASRSPAPAQGGAELPLWVKEEQQAFDAAKDEFVAEAKKIANLSDVAALMDRLDALDAQALAERRIAAIAERERAAQSGPQPGDLARMIEALEASTDGMFEKAAAPPPSQEPSENERVAAERAILAAARRDVEALEAAIAKGQAQPDVTQEPAAVPEGVSVPQAPSRTSGALAGLQREYDMYAAAKQAELEGRAQRDLARAAEINDMQNDLNAWNERLAMVRDFDRLLADLRGRPAAEPASPAPEGESVVPSAGGAPSQPETSLGSGGSGYPPGGGSGGGSAGAGSGAGGEGTGGSGAGAPSEGPSRWLNALRAAIIATLAWLGGPSDQQPPIAIAPPERQEIVEPPVQSPPQQSAGQPAQSPLQPTQPEGTRAPEQLEQQPQQRMQPIAAPQGLGRSYYELGDKNPEVKKLQQFLNTHGFPIAQSGSGSPGNETDEFGGKTLAAVRAFQRANGLAVDGRVGPQTIAAINRIIASGR